MSSISNEYFNLRNFLYILFIAPVLAAFVLLFIDDGNEFSSMGMADYSQFDNLKSCEKGSLKGEKGATYGEKTREGIKYNVRTPLNYDETIAHPLLVVYAPAKANRAKSERITNLTLEATNAGFIIAYADHPELSTSSSVELGTIPELMAKKWCIDENRTYLTGHSDGGTVAMAIAFMNGTKHIPTAIAASAAGVNYRDLSEHNCPAPISVMVMHSKIDRLFPDFGSESSGWWAACNDCAPIPKKLANGCVAYSGCKNDVKTWYCEGDQPHSKWPHQNTILLDFLASSERIER